MVENKQQLYRAFIGSFALTGCAFSLAIAPASAQQTDVKAEIEALRREIQQVNELNARLNERLQKLEAQTSANAVPTPSPIPSPAPGAESQASPTATPASARNAPLVATVQSASRTPIVVSGLLQIQGNAFFHQENVPAGTSPLADTGRLRRGQIRIAVPAITPRVSGMLMFDLAKTNNLTRTGSQLMDLVIGYRLDTKPRAPKLLEVGQFKIGFGYESDLVSSVDLAFTERSQIYTFRDLATLATSPALPGLAGGGLGNTRDVGVRLSGAFPKRKLNYNIGLFDGIGEGQNDVARGDAKAVVGRIFYGRRDTRNVVRGTMFGASAARADSRGVNAAGPLDRYAYQLFAGHLRDPELRQWQRDRFSYFGEYAVLKSKVATAPGTFKNGIGYYANLGYLINPHFEVVGRYDVFKQELTVGTGTSTELLAGLNYYFQSYREQGPKIQVNLVKVHGEPNALSTFDSFQLRTQYQLAF